MFKQRRSIVSLLFRLAFHSFDSYFTVSIQHIDASIDITLIAAISTFPFILRTKSASDRLYVHLQTFTRNLERFPSPSTRQCRFESFCRQYDEAPVYFIVLKAYSIHDMFIF